MSDKKKTIINEKEDFIVEIVEDVKDEESIIITSSQEMTNSLLKNAISSYAGNQRTYSKNIDEYSLMRTTLTESKLESLAFLPQDNLYKVQEINSYVDLYLNKDDIIGRTYEIIEANTNADYQLKYPEVKNKTILKKVQNIIDNFNKQIELEKLIIETIPYAYANGNRILYLRKTKYGKYQVERYPLGMVQISSYKINNEPIVLFNLTNLLQRITGSDLTFSPLNGTSLDNYDLQMFPNIEDEIKENFPKEVYNEFLNKNLTVAKLNTDLTAVIRVNNRGKKYGVSPIFKALNPALKLEVQEKSDTSNSKARGKKIIFQKISDKLLGEDGSITDIAPSAYSHNELIKAWGNEVVVYTGAPWVESISYVEPKTDLEHSNTLNYYKTKVLSALGISFLSGDSKSGMVVSELNFQELLRIIDKIGKQLSDNIVKWYKYILNEAGLPVEYAPNIEVLNSELLEMNLRMQLADNLFNKYGMSFESTYQMLGKDFESEKEKRIKENNEKLDSDIFYARQTAFTFSAKGDEDYNNSPTDNVDNKDKQNQTIKDEVNKDKK